MFLTLAGGESLNLQATPRMILYDMPFGIGYNVQIIGRIARKYSAFDKFYIHYMIAKNTIDEYKFNYLRMNESYFNLIIRNEIATDSEPEEGFNAYVLKALREELLW